MSRFTYEGAVLVFGALKELRWKASTVAPSEAKAKANLKYQFRRQHNYAQNTPIELCNRLRMINDGI